MRLEVDLAERTAAAQAPARERMEALLKQFAKKLAALRDSYQGREPYFLVAEALLQIAIVMSSVSIRPARA